MIPHSTWLILFTSYFVEYQDIFNSYLDISKSLSLWTGHAFTVEVTLIFCGYEKFNKHRPNCRTVDHIGSIL